MCTCRAAAEGRKAAAKLEAEVREFRSEAKRLEAVVKAKEREREAAELRAIKAEAATDSARSKASAETIAKVRHPSKSAEPCMCHLSAALAHVRRDAAVGDGGERTLCLVCMRCCA